MNIWMQAEVINYIVWKIVILLCCETVDELPYWLRTGAHFAPLKSIVSESSRLIVVNIAVKHGEVP